MTTEAARFTPEDVLNSSLSKMEGLLLAREHSKESAREVGVWESPEGVFIWQLYQLFV